MQKLRKGIGQKGLRFATDRAVSSWSWSLHATKRVPSMVQPHAAVGSWRACTAGGCICTLVGCELGRSRRPGRRWQLRRVSSARGRSGLLRGGPARRHNVGCGWGLACVVAPRRAVILPPVILHWLALGVPSVVLRCGGWGRAEVVIPRRMTPCAQAHAGGVPGSGSFRCFFVILLPLLQGQAGCGLGSRVQDLQLLAHLGHLGTRVDARLPVAALRGARGTRPRLEALRQERADVSLGTDMKMRAGGSYCAKI